MHANVVYNQSKVIFTSSYNHLTTTQEIEACANHQKFHYNITLPQLVSNILRWWMYGECITFITLA